MRRPRADQLFARRTDGQFPAPVALGVLASDEDIQGVAKRERRREGVVHGRLLRLHVVDVERSLLWWGGEAAFDALLHPRHQDAVAEPLPTLLGVVDCHNCPAAL